MELMLLGCLLQILGGLIALAVRDNNKASLTANLSVWLGCALAAIPVISVLSGNSINPVRLEWSLTGSQLVFGLDTLSAFFCLPFLVISPLAAMYGRSYLGNPERRLGSHWLFFNLLVASMLLLLTAQNVIMFIIVWEVMAVSSFFLVMHDHEQEKVRKAGWTYLIATHIGTIALLVFFAILGSETHSLDFGGIIANRKMIVHTGALFVLAIFGFGVKAGFFPLHVWLPEAHPAAPSHVSALMSGVMIKTGIYGILRTITLIGYTDAYLGWALVIIGIISGVTGVVFALAQHDLKRLLAYHSVENIGIITIGIGVGVLGIAWKLPALVFLGFGGGLLHVLNHALFKSLLFLGAGAVSHGTGTLDIELLGGLLKKMRWTAWTFLIGAAAIAGLPPFNGFISEFYIYFAGISGVRAFTPGPIILAAFVMVSLALIGGLAVACFSKAFGIVFLGEARTTKAANVHEADLQMLTPMVILAGLCVLIGLAAPLTVYLVKAPLGTLAGSDGFDFTGIMHHTRTVFGYVALIFGILYIISLVFYLIKKLLPRANQVSTTGTWDCGYAAPTARMQYTASSFAQPLTELFRSLLRTRKTSSRIKGYFPANTEFHTETPDVAKEGIFAPIFRLINNRISPLRQMQHGNLSGYLLYIAITLIVLLIWKAGF